MAVYAGNCTWDAAGIRTLASGQAGDWELIAYGAASGLHQAWLSADA